MKSSYYGKKYKKVSYKANSRYPSKSTKPSKEFTKKVKKVLNKVQETKIAWRQATNVNYNSVMTDATDVTNNYLVPNITNGTGISNRIGERITLKSLNIKGHIITNITNTTYENCRIGVRMLIVQPKDTSSQTSIDDTSGNWLYSLIREGGTTAAFGGLVRDLYSPINKDLITCYYDKLFYMQMPYNAISVTGVQNVQSMTKFFDINLKVKGKVLRYDNSVDGGVASVNFNPVLLIGYAKLDSSAADTGTTAKINLNYVSEIHFTDA